MPSFISDEYFRERWTKRNASGLSPAYLKHLQRLDAGALRNLAKAFTAKKSRMKKTGRSFNIVERLAVLEALLNRLIASGKL